MALRGALPRILALEAAAGQDLGKRGIDALKLPGALVGAAAVVAASRQPLVLTGFPCRLADDPPTENDGPAGAAAIVRLCARLGKSVTVATDECNEPTVRAAAQVAWRQGGGFRSAGWLRVLAVAPPLPGDDASMDRAVSECRGVAEGCDSVVAIERAGATAGGSYLTMSGKSMDHLIAPLGEAARAVAAGRGAGSGPLDGRVVGVGDGGNELGMGSVADLVRSSITNGEMIACVEPSDFLVVAGVSNWGGWAIAGAVEALLASGPGGGEGADGAAAGGAAAGTRTGGGGGGRSGLALAPEEALAASRSHVEVARCRGALPAGAPSLLPTDEEEREVMLAVAATGARDGVNGDDTASSCDNMPWSSTHLAVLAQMRACLA